MKLTNDDPKLTAYALGELSETEAKEVEAELSNSPALRETVQEIRQTAQLLKNEFSLEPAIVLSEYQKDTVVSKVQATNIIPFPRRKVFTVIGIGALAASLAFMLVRLPGFDSTKNNILSQTPATNSEFRYAQNAISQAQKSAPSDEKKTSPKKSEPEMILQEHIAEAATPPPVDSDLSLGVDPSKARPAAPMSDPARYGVSSVKNNPTPAPGRKSDTLERQVAPMQRESGKALTSATKAPQVLNEVSQDFDQYKRNDPKIERSAVNPPPTASGATALPGQKEYFKNPRDNGYPSFNLSRIESMPRTALADAGGGGHIYDTKTEKSVKSAMLPNDEIRSYLVTQGAELEPPSGVFVNGRDGKLLVKANDRDMKKIQPALRDFGVLPSVKIHDATDADEFNTYQFNVDHRFISRFTPSNGDTARYPKYVENSFESVLENPLSTFSIDVDTASYANMRRFLNEGRMPPQDAVRIEEMINYFSYNYPQPKNDEPFSANIEIASAPWKTKHRLVRVGLKGKEMAQDKRPPSNFVFLIDVSGSMSPAERLPLIKQALRMLVKRMTENDRVAMVVYASSSGTVLESTSCANKEKILEAIDRLEAGGSTNGGEGIQRAYNLAGENFIKGGVNRVILCTDGDFNVGITSQKDLLDLIKQKAKSGVFLSALGVGTDNYKDALMQKLADSGNGNYYYIDTMEEAHKVLVQQMNGTLVTIAKDVKIQIEFNPSQVSSYRLIGYEKRILAAEDFNNDKKDAGEIGAGHTVTAMYEIIPVGAEENAPRFVDNLKYQTKPTAKPKRVINDDNSELLTLKLRYKKPDGKVSKLMEVPVVDSKKQFSQASADFRFASAVAGFGMVLKESEHKGSANFNSVLKLAEESKGDDKEGYRAEFITLVKKAAKLKRGDN